LLRTNYRLHDVYFYPVQASPEEARALLREMLLRAERLERRPEFYNTLFNTCTTNIVRHIRILAPGSIPWSYKVLLPGYSDRLAYDLGFIPHDASFETIRRRHWISGRARSYKEGDNFSRLIRSNGETGGPAPQRQDSRNIGKR